MKLIVLGATGAQVASSLSRQTQLGISRVDLADYIIHHLNDPATSHAMVEVAY